jgi:hypothetical protein
MDCRAQANGRQAGTSMKKRKDPNRYPPGLNATKVKKIIEYYDKLNEDEIIGEFEQACDRHDSAMVQIPRRLLDRFRRFLMEERKSA